MNRHINKRSRALPPVVPPFLFLLISFKQQPALFPSYRKGFTKVYLFDTLDETFSHIGNDSHLHLP